MSEPLSIAAVTGTGNKVIGFSESLQATGTDAVVIGLKPYFIEDRIKASAARQLKPFEISVRKAQDDLAAVRNAIAGRPVTEEDTVFMSAYEWFKAHQLLDTSKQYVRAPSIAIFHDVETEVNGKSYGQAKTINEWWQMVREIRGQENVHIAGITGLKLPKEGQKASDFPMISVGVRVSTWMKNFSMESLAQHLEMGDGVQEHLGIASGLSMKHCYDFYDTRKPLTVDVFWDILHEPEKFERILSLSSWANLGDQFPEAVNMLKDGLEPRVAREIIAMLR